ncbi:MAG TPA: hypothetical protein VGJ30_08825 [Candidatus Angelobacter sp.]|jgi:hypothetical protein
MKKKVSIKLPADVLPQRERADSDAQDLALINAAAHSLNHEAADVLDYQMIF